MNLIFLSIYWDEECFTQKLQKEMNAQSHLNSSAINISYMNHGESFTIEAFLTMQLTQICFPSAVSKIQWKGRNNVINQK
jgi:hypothetical protein